MTFGIPIREKNASWRSGWEIPPVKMEASTVLGTRMSILSIRSCSKDFR